MRFLFKLFVIAGIFIGAYAAFQNFSQVVPLTSAPEVLAKQKEQVVIDGKYYDKNARGVYNVNGVPTLVRNGDKIKAKSEVPPAVTHSNLGKPIDPGIYREAIGSE